jgi:hypothetical protein
MPSTSTCRARSASCRARAYGFTEADLDRKIFHRSRARASSLRRCARSSRSCAAPIARRIGVEFMHITDPAQKGWMQERIEGPDKEITFTAKGKKRDPQQADRGGRLREVPRRQVHRHQALRPRRRRSDDPGARADHQARRPARREGDRARHGASRPPQRARQRDGEAASRDLPRVQGRLVRSPTTSKARAT